MTGVASLAGLRILVVEDDWAIAVFIEDALRDFGCVIVGPAAKLEVALQLATDELLDAAVLDVTIRGGKVYPVAERLRARGIPFALASGYGDWSLPENLQGQPRLTKPFTAQELTKQVEAMCKRPQAGGERPALSA